MMIFKKKKPQKYTVEKLEWTGKQNVWTERHTCASLRNVALKTGIKYDELDRVFNFIHVDELIRKTETGTWRIAYV